MAIDSGMQPGSNVYHSQSSAARCPACCPARRAWQADARAGLPEPIAAALLLVPSLTARELATFHLLGIGYGNNSIARTLSISERTVKRHITAVLTKLGLTSRLQAGLAAMAMTLVMAEPTCGCADSA